MSRQFIGILDKDGTNVGMVKSSKIVGIICIDANTEDERVSIYVEGDSEPYNSYEKYNDFLLRTGFMWGEE